MTCTKCLLHAQTVLSALAWAVYLVVMQVATVLSILQMKMEALVTKLH